MPARVSDPLRQCQHCGTSLARKRFSSGVLEGPAQFRARKFCGTECQRLAQIDPTSTNRQTMYSRSRKHLKSACERCGAESRLHVHHRDEDICNNASSNLETLCARCHNRHHAR